MTGGNEEGQSKQACKKEACAIQSCLSRNQYHMQRCQHAVENLRKCCEGYEDRSVHCQMGPKKL